MERKICRFCFLAALCCLKTAAQETKTIDLFLGYSYTQVHTSNVSGLGTLGLNGGDVSLSYRFSRWITGVADFNIATTGGYKNSDIVGIQLGGTQRSYLFGPRVALPTWRRFTLFGEGLIGVANAPKGLYDTTSSQSSLAWQVGGGLDVRLSDKFSIRPAEIGFFQTRFSEFNVGTQTQNNLRLSTGLVFHF